MTGTVHRVRRHLLQRVRTGHTAGTALVVVMGVVTILSVLGAVVPSVMTVETAYARRFATEIRAHYAARSGVEHGLSQAVESVTSAPTLQQAEHDLDRTCRYRVTWQPFRGPISESSLTELPAPFRKLLVPHTPIAVETSGIIVCSRGNVMRGARPTATARIVVIAARSEDGWQTLYWNED